MTSSTKRAHRIKKWGFAQAGIIAMVLMSAIAAIGTGYGSLTETLDIDGTANAGHIRYTTVSTSEGCIAGHTPGEAEATLAMENAYPGLSCTAWFDITNTGAVPLNIKRIVLETDYGTAFGAAAVELHGNETPTGIDLDNAPADGNIATDPDIAVEIEGIYINQQIAPGEAVRMAVHQRVLEAAPQNAALKYTLAVEFGQWAATGDTTTETTD